MHMYSQVCAIVCKICPYYLKDWLSVFHREEQTAHLLIFFLRTGTALDTPYCAVFTYLNGKVDTNEELPVLRCGSWSCCARSWHNFSLRHRPLRDL